MAENYQLPWTFILVCHTLQQTAASGKSSRESTIHYLIRVRFPSSFSNSISATVPSLSNQSQNFFKQNSWIRHRIARFISHVAVSTCPKNCASTTWFFVLLMSVQYNVYQTMIFAINCPQISRFLLYFFIAFPALSILPTATRVYSHHFGISSTWGAVKWRHWSISVWCMHSADCRTRKRGTKRHGRKVSVGFKSSAWNVATIKWFITKDWPGICAISYCIDVQPFKSERFFRLFCFPVLLLSSHVMPMRTVSWHCPRNKILLLCVSYHR